MRRIIPITIAIMLIVSITAPTSFADNNRSKNSWKANYSSYFKDIDDYGWARNSILSLAKYNIIRGEGYGLFSPRRSTKEIEIIVMLIRMLDLEDKLEDYDESYDELPDEYMGGRPPKWMIPYIALAWDEGILNEDTIRNLKPNASLSREKAAMYIMEALEGKDAYEDTYEALEEWFEDADSINSRYGWYVYRMRSRGLMIGFNHKFQPKKALSRAECAVLMHRIFNLYDFPFGFDKDDDNQDRVTGTLEDFDYDDDVLDWIEVDSDEFDDIDEDVIIEIGNNCSDDAEDKLDELEDKHIGLEVKAYFEDDAVDRIVVFYDELEGELEYDTNLDDNGSVDIIPDGKPNAEDFVFDTDMEIFMNGKETSVSQFEDFDMDSDIDYEVDARLLGDGTVIELCISFDEEEPDTEGQLESFDYDGSRLDEITLKHNGDETTFDDIDTNVEILIDNPCDDAEDELVKLESKHLGLEVRVRLDDGVVDRIVVFYDELEGELEYDTNLDDNGSVDIIPDGSSNAEEYVFDTDIEIFIER